MFFGSNVRFRCCCFVIISLFIGLGFCSSSKIRTLNNSDNNYTSSSKRPTTVVVPFQSNFVVSNIKNQYPIAITSYKKWLDWLSIESVVSTLISSPNIMIHFNKLKNQAINYYEKYYRNKSEVGRGHGHSHHGHGGYGGVGFPSLEGALLALAFLTFAVFLIDLIQVTHRKQIVGRYSTGIGSTIFGRRKRDLLKFNTDNPKYLSTITSEVLTSIESPLFQ